jgi:hypothetical protein
MFGYHELEKGNVLGLSTRFWASHLSNYIYRSDTKHPRSEIITLIIGQ